MGFELAKKIKLWPESFQVVGILTSTMKLQRYQAKKLFEDEINKLYGKWLTKKNIHNIINSFRFVLVGGLSFQFLFDDKISSIVRFLSFPGVDISFWCVYWVVLSCIAWHRFSLIQAHSGIYLTVYSIAIVFG